MIAAGEIPNLSDASDLRRTRGATTWRRWISPVLVLTPCLLFQGCGNSQNKSVADNDAAIARTASSKGDILVSRTSTAVSQPGDSFSDRYIGDSFADRYGATHGFAPSLARGPSVAAVERTASIPGSYKVASLSPELPYGLPAVKQGQTHLIGFENSAFPYFGKNPRSGGGAYAEGSRYSDNRVLVHVPAGFDAKKPGVIVVFFHGHGATLERDVRDRQLLPKQITESGVNAVMVAPQLAYDAADSSAGKFWERGGFKRFMVEAQGHLAKLYGDPRSADAFAKMPVIIVAYSGGFLTAASSLQVGGLGSRVRGVVLLDALYGELDKFASWIVNNRAGFFVSAYTQHNKRRDDELERMLRDKGITAVHELAGPLKPGTVAFLAAGDGLTHRDFVTLAWADHPVKDMLQRIARR